MQDKIKSAFDVIQAGPALKAKTLDALRKRDRRHAPARRWVPAIACLLAVVLVLGGCGIYFTPAAAIQIEINPALELTVNRFDRVIGVTALNPDGERLLTSLDLRFSNYLDAVAAVLESETVSTLLAQDRQASIAISSGDASRQEAMVKAVSTCAAQYGKNVHCSAGHHGQGSTAATAQPSVSPGATSQPTPAQSGHHGQGSPSAGSSPSPDGTQQSAQNQYRHHGSNGHHGG